MIIDRGITYNIKGAEKKLFLGLKKLKNRWKKSLLSLFSTTKIEKWIVTFDRFLIIDTYSFNHIRLITIRTLKSLLRIYIEMISDWSEIEACKVNRKKTKDWTCEG